MNTLMKNALIGASFLLSAQQTFALMPDTMPGLVDVNEKAGEVSVERFNETMTQSPLYALLAALDTEAPLIAKTAKYVVMVNEAHQINTTLTQLLEATQKNNQLLEQLLIKQGIQYG